MKKFDALFLDRDGVINNDYGHVGYWNDFRYVDKFLEAINTLKNHYEKLFIVTNQAGIAKGKYTVEDFKKLNDTMVRDLGMKGVKVDQTYFCAHHPNGVIPEYSKQCNCRKPNPGMLNRAISEHNLQPVNCMMVGDKCSDILAANRAGIGRCYLVRSDGRLKFDECDSPCHKANSLHDVALKLDVS